MVEADDMNVIGLSSFSSPDQLLEHVNIDVKANVNDSCERDKIIRKMKDVGLAPQLSP